MRPVFLVLGYGIPKNILKDENYSRYIGVALNTIFDIVSSKKVKNPLIIFNGGSSDCRPPYQKTEAEEMAKLFKTLMNNRTLKSQTKNWKSTLQKKALSTVENLLFSHDIIRKKNLKNCAVYIFCEKTRTRRINILSKRIFNPDSVGIQSFRCIPIDFDQSENRYLDPRFIAKKEQAELKRELSVIENPKHLKLYQKALKERQRRLREAGPGKHAEEVRKWWEEESKFLI